MTPTPRRDTRPADVQRIDGRETYRNDWMSVTEDVVRRSDGSRGIYGVVHRAPGVVVIARRVVDDVEEFCVVEQYRYPVGARRWEFPAGTADAVDTDPVGAARRELREETGLAASTLRLLAVLDVAPGFTAQQTTIVLAEDLADGEHHRDSTESDMTWTWWTRDEVVSAIVGGRIVDAQSIAGWAVLLSHAE
ncbi:NUDIX hydrolase [uncultured Williamsia sp.]|uniref:NUDIX domain-containing protein n=1 Tax=uncultured Williamsia sp. TaxID=259311 RepID=UPI002602453E|nr:NUDIX hydrolase [uncultured Williamsia sp.]